MFDDQHIKGIVRRSKHNLFHYFNYYFIIFIIKMASVFKLPDVNVYECVCRMGGGWGVGEVR